MDNNNQNYIERLNKLKELAEKKQAEKTRAEANLENLQNRKKEIEAELADMGIKPEELEKEINELQASIEDGLSRAEALLNGNVNGDEVTEADTAEQAV